MEIYIEYALLENFLFDGILLTLALFAAKRKIKWRKVCFSAGVGAVFAVLYPLLKLPEFLGTLFKMAVGLLLCLLVEDRLKTRKEWGRYALTSVFFFIFSVSFGGTLLGIYGSGTRVPSALVFVGFAVLSLAALLLVKKLYARREIHKNVYPCIVKNGERTISTEAFSDSGNLARKNGKPVCFLSPELFYELYGEEILKGEGQVCDEMAITTLAGEKTIPLYAGKIEINEIIKEVYFSPSKNMIGREYKVLVNLGSEEHETD